MTAERLELRHLALQHFKGVRSLTIEVSGGSDIQIRGDNATGKTTCADAFSWLLFGRDSLGRADFEVKTLTPAGEPHHGLDHQVEATLRRPNGFELSLRRTYREKWSKRRGEARREFTGHTTEYALDGVPVGAREYEEAVRQLVPEDTFRLLTDPLEFAERLHWTKRREVLMAVCGEVRDEEIFDSNEDLSELPSLLNGRSIEGHRTVLVSRRAALNKELETIPVRVDEVERGLPTPAGTPEEVQRKLERLAAEREAAVERLRRIQTGVEAVEIQGELRKLEAETAGYTAEARRVRSLVLDRLHDEARDARRRKEEVEAALAAARTEEAALARRRELLCLEIEELRHRWFKEDERSFGGQDTCPTCGQPLPLEEREAAVATFNYEKSVNLASITEQGKALQKELAALANFKAAVGRPSEASLESATSAVEKAVEAIEAAENAPLDLEAVEGYTAAEKKRAELAARLAALRNDRAGEVEAAEHALAGIEEAFISATAEAAAHRNRATAEARLVELTAEEERLAAEFEELERQLFLLEQFTRRRVSLIESRVNEKFQLARFKLFEQQVNGGLRDVCEVTHDGVPWGSLNTGAQINVGLDIIDTLAKHWGVAPPIFIDHAESVTDIRVTTGQQFRLLVAPGIRPLQVETHPRR